MPPKKPPQTVRAFTREKRQASQASRGPASKTPRSAPSNITRTIHQQVNDNSSMVAGAPNLGSPSASSVHSFGVQHAGSHTPTLGYSLPSSNQSPAQWWGPWGPLLHGPNTINCGHLCLLQQFQAIATMHLINNTQHINNGSRILYRPTNPWWPIIIQVARVHRISKKTKKINHLQTAK